MKAVIIDRHGSYDVLRYVTDFPEPVAAAGEAIVRVAATTLNRIDTLMRSGYPGITLKFPHVAGADIAGIIVEAPAGSGFAAGERVAAYPVVHCGECEWCRKGRTGLCLAWQFFGMHRHGSYGELVRVPVRCLVRIPDTVSFEHAKSPAFSRSVWMTSSSKLSAVGTPGQPVTSA